MERSLDLLGTVGQFRAVALPAVTSSPSDREVVRAARGGDRAAFGQLYERYARMIHGILLARIHPADCEDLVQDVFLTALRQLPALRDDGAFGGWLAIIARNRANDHYRRRRETAELPEELPGGEEPQVQALMVIEIVRSLPEAYHEPLVLRLVEGMTGDEIAERTGLTSASVRVNLSRGMKLLREKLAEGRDSPGGLTPGKEARP